MTCKIIHIPAGGLDPENQPKIIEIEQLDLNTMQKFVGGYIEHLGLAKGIDLFFNEEGRLTGLPPNRLFKRFDGYEFDILGDAIICASNEDGEEIGLTVDQAKKWLNTVMQLPIGLEIDGKTVWGTP